MRLIATIQVGWLMFASGISAAAIPHDNADLAADSPAAEASAVKTTFDGALSGSFSQGEEEKVRAALKASIDNMSEEDRQSKGNLNLELSKVLNDSQVQKVDVALDVAFKKATEIFSRSAAKQPIVSARDMSSLAPDSASKTDKGAQSQVNSTTTNPARCDCRLPVNRIKFLDDLETNRTDSRTVVCFKFCVTRTNVVLTNQPKTPRGASRLLYLIKTLEALLKSPRTEKKFIDNTYLPIRKPPVNDGNKTRELFEWLEEPYPSSIIERDVPTKTEKTNPLESPESFNASVTIGKKICNCAEIGHEVVEYLKLKPTGWNRFEMLFYKRRNTICFAACLKEARKWVKDHDATHAAKNDTARPLEPSSKEDVVAHAPQQLKPLDSAPSLSKRKYNPPGHLSDGPRSSLSRPPPEEGQEEIAPNEKPQPLPLPQMPDVNPLEPNRPSWPRTYAMRFDNTGPEEDCSRALWILARHDAKPSTFHEVDWKAWRSTHKPLLINCAVAAQIPRPDHPTQAEPEWHPELPDWHAMDDNPDVTRNPKHNFRLDPPREPTGERIPPPPQSPTDPVLAERVAEYKRFRAWAKNYGRRLNCGEHFEVNEQWKRVSKGGDGLAKKYYQAFRYRNQERLKFCKGLSSAEVWGDVEEDDEVWNPFVGEGVNA